MEKWLGKVEETRALPTTLAAASALDAWEAVQPWKHRPWLGHLLAAALLRERGKSGVHLSCLAVGLQDCPSERRRSADPTSALSPDSLERSRGRRDGPQGP